MIRPQRSYRVREHRCHHREAGRHRTSGAAALRGLPTSFPLTGVRGRIFGGRRFHTDGRCGAAATLVCVLVAPVSTARGWPQFSWWWQQHQSLSRHRSGGGRDGYWKRCNRLRAPTIWEVEGREGCMSQIMMSLPKHCFSLAQT